jgi:proline dehydrogenase
VATGRLGWLVASRFVAGDTLDAAIASARALRERGCAAILDHLGENVTTVAGAADAARAYVRALDRIEDERDLDATISVKLTQLGLDFSTDLAVGNLERVLAAARDRTVMIDMESSAYVDRTLEVHRALRRGTDRVGVCLQAYLQRTPRDVEALPDRSVVRLVKGAYLEPPEVAIEDRREVDRAFARLTATLLARGHTVHVATHDPALLDGAVRYVERSGMSWKRVDLQFLHGVRRDLQARFAGGGFPVTVYVPYGTEWYPYLTRRLAERPANMWFFLSNVARVRR